VIGNHEGPQVFTTKDTKSTKYCPDVIISFVYFVIFVVWRHAVLARNLHEWA
jgi:hypothetical protein